MKLRSIVAATSLFTIGGMGLFAAPASADLVTTCNGVGGAVTVPGDLIVQAGKSCSLTGTTVEGNVTVRAGADLVVNGGTFKGNVTVQEDGYFDAVDTTISNAVTARSAFGTYLEDSSLGANLRAVPIAGSDVSGFVFGVGSSVGGAVNATTGDLFLDGATVSGAVTADGTGYADIYDTVVNGNLRIANNADGSVFCGGEVYGGATYINNSSIVQVGSDGPASACSDVSYWDKNVTIRDNTATIHVDNNIVRGNLTAQGNSPAALAGENNRVRGTITGDLGTIGSGFAARMAQVDHSAELEAKAEERRGEAKADAKQAGKAF
ncbi:hypothetical protein [Nocardiopsis ansamitocini]|uniref:Uncharacterized protein n=1 Tax=Nocardiopsis ansamitocini TaxID=1670832 RepID=A0A9W6P6P0_9ACTN|nr:hypothetical protein [Nocardiopsis ansamitocini]GLU47993.1 hypothetical protein Nans01_23440 [Nocardiopsis ansamitocini]